MASAIYALLRALNGDLLRYEHGSLNGSLSCGDTELHLSLIELSNDLVHGRLIQIG
ncbi:MAG TPA: hypothetical protein VIS96_00625 [Terrimicrobiaceae bacterium]